MYIWAPTKMDDRNQPVWQSQQQIYSLFQPTKNSTVPMQLIEESSHSNDEDFVFEDFNSSNSPHAEICSFKGASLPLQQCIPLIFQHGPLSANSELFSIDTSYMAPHWPDEQVEICSSFSQNLPNSSQSFSTHSAHSQIESPQRSKNYKWSDKEDAALEEIMEHGQQTWKGIAQKLSIVAGTPERTPDQVSQHWIRVLNPRIQKGRWTKEEDEMLIEACLKSTPKQWKEVSHLVVGRTGIECRYRVREIGEKLVESGVLNSAWL